MILKYNWVLVIMLNLIYNDNSLFKYIVTFGEGKKMERIKSFFIDYVKYFIMIFEFLLMFLLCFIAVIPLGLAAIIGLIAIGIFIKLLIATFTINYLFIIPTVLYLPLLIMICAGCKKIYNRCDNFFTIYIWSIRCSIFVAIQSFRRHNCLLFLLYQ